MTNQSPVSAVLITLNAASQLRRTLDSLRFCDDLVIVDSGSTDGTLVIAEEFGARVFQKEWMGFGPQKQYAVQQARHDWVLCLDADEQVSVELRQSIQHTLSSGPAPNVAGYDMPRCNYFLGRFLRHGEGYPDLSRRLFHKDRARWSDDAVHEKVIANGDAGFEKLSGDLLHYSADSLSVYMGKQNRYTDIQAHELAARGKWPGTAKLVLSPFVRFIKFYFVRKGFLDGWPGFVHICIGCFNSFMKYAKTREQISASKE